MFSEMDKQTIIQILIGLGVLIIFIIISALILADMSEKIERECSKVNDTGMIKFLDVDIDCSKILNITSVENGM